MSPTVYFLCHKNFLPADTGFPRSPESWAERETKKPNWRCQNLCNHSWGFYQLSHIYILLDIDYKRRGNAIFSNYSKLRYAIVNHKIVQEYQLLMKLWTSKILFYIPKIKIYILLVFQFLTPFPNDISMLY